MKDKSLEYIIINKAGESKEVIKGCDGALREL